MLARLTFIAAVLSAPVAAAQTPPSFAATEIPATAEEIAEARAYADTLIDAANAGAHFVNKTDSAVPEVEHLASGMRCLFNTNGHDRILLFPSQNDRIPLGDDVGCASQEEALVVETTSYATRYRPLPSEDTVVADSVRAIRNRWPDAIPFEGALALMSSAGEETPKFAAFKVTTSQGPMLTMVLVDHVGEWGFKVRATGRFEDAMLVSVYGGFVMSNVRSSATAD